MKKKWLALLLCVAMTATMLAACGNNDDGASDDKAASSDAGDSNDGGSDDLIVVGYAQVGAESDWRTANTASFKEHFVAENGYELIFDDAQQKQENQIKAIRSFIQQDVDYIVLAPTTETGWDTVLQEAKDAGIPVVLSDRMIETNDDSLYEAWVGGNFVEEGEKAGDWLEEYLKELGRDEEEINVVVLQGTIGASAQIGRTEGFKSKLEEHDNWNLLDSQTGDFTQSLGQEVMESFLKQYDNIDVVIAENDNMAFGAVDAIKDVGKKPGEDIIIVSFDAVKAALQAIVAGEINCAVECNPLHGPRVAEIIETLEDGKEIENKIWYVDEGLFDAKNAEEALPTRAY